MYGRNSKLSKYGGLSVGVPGELRGLAEIHKRWGKLPWKRVVEPSAQLARGWTVSAELDKKLHVRLLFCATIWLVITYLILGYSRSGLVNGYWTILIGGQVLPPWANYFTLVNRYHARHMHRL